MRLALAVACLLSGVVCGAANVGSAAIGLNFAPPKPDLVRETSRKAERSEQASTKTSTSETETALPDETPAAVRLSRGYHLVNGAVRDLLRSGRPTAALKLLKTDPVALKLKNSEFDRIKAQIAQSYLIEGKIDRAAEVAEEAAARSGQSVPLAGWVAGQAAWRRGDYAHSADMFALTAMSKDSSSWLASGGAFWAARASFRAGRFDEVHEWQEQAAKYPQTFYGLVALKALGRSYDFNWDLPSLGFSGKEKISRSALVQDALRQAKAGNVTAAIDALSQSGWMSTNEKREQLLAFMIDRKVPSLELYVARRTKSKDGKFYDLALYPESPWEPESGYQVDKAIVHALIRQESRFNPHATSHLGATGLMQLLPSTAKFVARSEDVALTDPQKNIEIGQKYIGQLMRDPAVNNDLFHLAVAYNAGPGNLSRWKKKLKDVDDPLLFIESIPSAETRAFVERVMVNYWIYRTRMGQDVPSLDVVASLDRQEPVRMAETIGSNLMALAANW